MLTVICRQNILRTITIKEVLILVTVFNPDNYVGIVIANTTLLYKYCIVCFVHVSMSLPLLILLWNKYLWIISILFFSRYYGFPPPPRYNWNIIESGLRHHNPPPPYYFSLALINNVFAKWEWSMYFLKFATVYSVVKRWIK
jgi:hypothetical protein